MFIVKEYGDISQIWESAVIVASIFYTPPRQYTEVLGRKLLHHLSLTCLRIIYLAAFCWHAVVGIDFLMGFRMFLMGCVIYKCQIDPNYTIQIWQVSKAVPPLEKPDDRSGKFDPLAFWCTQLAP